jgi:tetratricopeptide (TPR) repeat protein
MVDKITHSPTQHPAPTEPGTCLRRGIDLHQAGQLDAAASCYRAALQQRPDFSPAWATLGLARMAAGALDEAEQHQREALRLDPTLPEAHNGLGLVHYEYGRVAEAENCFRGCLRLWPEHPGAHLNLAVALQSRGHLNAAEASYRDALRFGADAAQVYNNLSVLLREMGRVGEAETAVRTALRLRPDMPDAQVNLAMILLLTGRWAEAWPRYEARWQIGNPAAQHRPFPQPLWTGEQPVAGKTILLHAEQGFGDTLQFCRYAPLVAAQGARVVLEVQPPLVRLLARLHNVAQVVAAGEALPDFDLHCPLMSLPRAFATTPETVPASVPYLTADPPHQAAWRDALAPLPGRRVGLVWAGSARAWLPHAAALDRRRSMRLADMAPLAAVRGCSFVSLQLGPPAAQLNDPPTGLPVHKVAEVLGDFADTAALVANLDLVIAVDTAVAHLAGALGRPVWLLNRFDTCWRWLLGRDDSPWYPTLRQFRHDGREDWPTVMQRVAAALESFSLSPCGRGSG